MESAENISNGLFHKMACANQCGAAKALPSMGPILGKQEVRKSRFLKLLWACLFKVLQGKSCLVLAIFGLQR